MDYSDYHLTLRDNIKIILFSLLLTVLVSQLFYDSWYGMVAVIPCFIFMRRLLRRQRIEDQKKKLAGEFLDAMQIVSNCLLSGSSMENAWAEAETELSRLHGADSAMVTEMAHINASVRVNQTLEVQIAEFAERSGLEDVKNFSEVFSFAKRSGGNLVGIIENTVSKMRAKLEVEQEIDVLVAAKKLEQKVLDVIPVMILGYLRLTSGDYLDVLYGNSFGVLFMTGALAAYGGAVYLSERILKIQV